jgi:8-oxo-dGTP pyrophosphatase MutT (NUDIX family)
MASLGHGNYVVILLTVGDSKASHIKLVVRHEPRAGRTWFHVGSILPDEELVDVVVRELHEETGFTLTTDD